MNEGLIQAAQNLCGLAPGQPVLVGVSGGADSLCLAHVLAQAGYPLVIAHFDHGLRPESAGEASQVGAFAGRLGAKFIAGSEDVQAYAGQGRLSLEEAARIRRYTFLFQEAARQSVPAVAVAHNANDQVETVLMHLLRGAGLSGLSGMAYRSLPNPWSQTIPLVRPLLGTWREEIEAYNAHHGLVPMEDPTNRDTRFYRNRLRHELIPYLETYNPAVRTSLWRTAEVLREDERLLESLTEAAWERCQRGAGDGWVSFSLPELAAEPTGIQRRLLRKAIQELLPGLRDISLAAIQRGLDYLQRPSDGGQVDLAAGLSLRRESEEAILAAWNADLPSSSWPQVDGDAIQELSAPGEVDLLGGWRVAAGAPTAPPEEPDMGDPFQAWLDADSLELPFKLRARRPGDRIRPLGMQNHSMKISDLMINEGLPARARSGWPLLLSGDEVIWVPGLRTGERFRLRESTRSAIHLRVFRPASQSE